MKAQETVYIAGPISNNPDYRLEFEWAENLLRREGFRVLTPAVLPEGMTRAQYMRICFAMIDTADACVFLPGWQESGGACLEYEYCIYTRKPRGFIKEDKEQELQLTWRGGD